MPLSKEDKVNNNLMNYNMPNHYYYSSASPDFEGNQNYDDFDAAGQYKYDNNNNNVYYPNPTNLFSINPFLPVGMFHNNGIFGNLLYNPQNTVEVDFE